MTNILRLIRAKKFAHIKEYYNKERTLKIKCRNWPKVLVLFIAWKSVPGCFSPLLWARKLSAYIPSGAQGLKTKTLCFHEFLVTTILKTALTSSLFSVEVTGRSILP